LGFKDLGVGVIEDLKVGFVEIGGIYIGLWRL
jgi:hypothetical protein